ncbi:putative deacetylase LmbE-like domain-containing protein [Russula dissimulans]|nr:putative deacetylase LmbE-like domain-containing protein [Russula dissimulans]
MLIVIRPGLFAILASAPVFLGLLLQPLHLGDIFPLEFSKSHPSPPRILLLTAHPDDETFFFGPTVTSLIPSYAVPVSASPRANTLDSVTPTFPQVYSLCLSVGNADGLGDIRRRELEESLDVLGVAEDKRWVLDKLEFQDDMNTKWDAGLIADTVYDYITDYNISTILTFDSYGVSGHPNHLSLYRGVSHLLATLPAGSRYPVAAYSLKSKPIIVKYTGILAPMLIKLKVGFSRALDTLVQGRQGSSFLSPVRPIFVAGLKEYRQTVSATLRHRSQRAWFRWLYMAFSQYMWVNEWERIQALADRAAS